MGTMAFAKRLICIFRPSREARPLAGYQSLNDLEIEKMPDLSKMFDGKKYMWNGQEYRGRDSAEKAKENYVQDGFEVEIVQDNSNYLVYSRRLVTEIVLDGEGAP